MFAGIIEGTRPVTALKKQSDGIKIHIDLQDLSLDVKFGDSIAIDGVCLTVAELNKTVATFHIMTETLRKTTLGSLEVGTLVNIERSLTANTRVHGHFVQGHVFGLGEITERVDTEKEFKLWINAGPLMKYIAPVGSVAVNGVSLTVAEIRDNEFAIALIPVTLKLTNLGGLHKGAQVNLEPDMIARQIIHFLEHRSSGSI